MRFHPELEFSFLTARNTALARSDTGVAALSWCLWLTQLTSFALSHQKRMCGKAALLLALNFLPLAEGRDWVICRARIRCLTVFKLCVFALLCWEVGRYSSSGGGSDGAVGTPTTSDSGLLGCLMHGCSGSELSAAAEAVRKQSASVAVSSSMGACRSLLIQEGMPADVCLSDDWVSSGAAQPPAEQVTFQQGSAAVTALLSEVGQSKLFALAHAGLAFRYCRWQHTAALQSVLLAVAVGQTAWQDVCGRPELASYARSKPIMQQVASILTNLHWLPLRAPVEMSSVRNGVGAAAPLLFSLPSQLDTCRLLLTWLQLCFGWVLPIWVAVLSETYARARFAEQHVAHLQPAEKEWAVMAAVGFEWVSLTYQFPMLCLIAWHLLMAAAVGAARWQSGSGGGSH